jgi:hypothetical protein
MIKTFLVAAAGVVVSAAAYADGDAAPKQAYHLEPMAMVQIQPFDSQHCLRETGSRIARVDSGDTPCISANGRVYNNDDMNAGGSLSLGDVLRRDPAILSTGAGRFR